MRKADFIDVYQIETADNCSDGAYQKEPGIKESTLALEGLEEYNPAKDGDARYINNLGIALVYIGKIRGWVALTDYA